MDQRRELLAYVIGAGIAGTLLLGPFSGPSIATMFVPGFHPSTYLSLFVLPIPWGLWNWWWVRRERAFGIGVWGAILGALTALAVNLFLAAQGQWAPFSLLFVPGAPAVYYVVWSRIIGPINHILGL